MAIVSKGLLEELAVEPDLLFSSPSIKGVVVALVSASQPPVAAGDMWPLVHLRALREVRLGG